MWIDADVGSIVGAHLIHQLNEDQKRYLNFIAEHGSINISDAARLSGGKNWHSAKKLLMTLVGMGIVEHVHRDDIVRDSHAHFVLCNGSQE